MTTYVFKYKWNTLIACDEENYAHHNNDRGAARRMASTRVAAAMGEKK